MVAFPGTMKARWIRLAFGACCCFAAKVICAQQAPGIQNVGNVSSYSTTLAPGVIFFVNASYGASLTDGSTAVAAGTPLPTRLAGARVLVNGVAAPLFAASPQQIRAQFPVEMTDITTAGIQVEVQSGAGTVMSGVSNVSVAPFSPGILLTNQPQFGAPAYNEPAAILRATDYSQICRQGTSACTANPASPGEVVTIYMIGLGAVAGPWLTGDATGQASATLTTPVVTIGGVPAKVLFAGLTAGFVGLYQVNVTVPATTVRGDNVPLIVSIGGIPSNQVSIAITPPADVPQGGGPPAAAANAMAVDPQHNLTVYAATNNGVFKSMDGAQNWTAIGTGLTNLYVQVLGVDPIHGGTIYAGTNGSGLFKSTDGGANWIAMNNGLSSASFTYVRALAIDPRNSANLYVITSGVFKSADGGASWSDTGLKAPSGSFQALAIDPSNPATIYTAAASVIYKTTDAGATWAAIGGPKFTFANGNTAPISVSALVVDPSKTNILYAFGGGPQTGIFKSSDGGANWDFLSLPALPPGPPIALAVDPFNSNTLYAAWYQGGLKSSDGGSTWIPVSGFPLAFDPQSPGVAYGNGSDGIVKSADGGTTWKGASRGLAEANVFSLAVDPRGVNVYAMTRMQATAPAFNTSKLWKTANGGISWSDTVTSSVAINAFAIAPSTPDIVYVIKEGALYKSTDAGSTYKAVSSNGLNGPLGSSLIIDSSNPNILYTGTGTSVLKSVDGGASWAAVSSGVKCCISQLAIDPKNSVVMYAGVGGSGVGDGLYKTTDGGATWQGIWNGSAHGVRTFLISRSNPARMFVMSNSGLFFKSADAGASWTPVNFGIAYTFSTALLMDPSNSDVIYAGSGIGLLKSSDGGATWNASSFGLSNLIVDALASGSASNSTVLYAGTGGAGVFMSTDGGATWRPMGAGR
jgi:uncharacterized protein (TIGR03437 family)